MWSCATQRPFSGQRCLSENGLKFHCQSLIFFWSRISVKVVWRCWTRLCQIVPFFLHTVTSLWKWSRLPCQLFCALRRNMFLKTVWTFHLVCVCVLSIKNVCVWSKISLKLVHNAFTCLLCLVKVQFLKTVWSLTASVHLFCSKMSLLCCSDQRCLSENDLKFHLI